MNSKPPIARMAAIRAALLERRHSPRPQPVNAQSLAAVLEVDARTIRRDLHFMRDRLGYDLRWDNIDNTYNLVAIPAPIL